MKESYLTLRDAAIIEAFTGFVMLMGEERNEIYKYMQEVNGGVPVYTEELSEYRDKYDGVIKDDFVKLCEKLYESRRKEEKSNNKQKRRDKNGKESRQKPLQ